MRLRVLARPVALALLALTLAACGGNGGSDANPIATAVEKTMEQVSERSTLNGRVTLAGQDRLLRGQGGFDHVKREGYLELALTVPGSGTATVDEVFVKSSFWLKSPLFAGSLPAGKEWIKVDLSSSSEALGFNFKTLLGQTSHDALEQLRRTVANVTEIGEEEIDGVQTTHYRAAVDPGKVPRNDRLQKLSGAVYKPIDVWIDGDDLVRQVRLDYTAKADPTRPERAHAVITMKLLDFGATVDVEPPPAGLVVDATDPVAGG